jgi:hypothetical protein
MNFLDEDEDNQAADQADYQAVDQADADNQHHPIEDNHQQAQVPPVDGQQGEKIGLFKSFSQSLLQS